MLIISHLSDLNKRAGFVQVAGPRGDGDVVAEDAAVSGSQNVALENITVDAG